MHHQSTLAKNKQQKHPKVNLSQYLYYSAEPRDDSSHDESAGLEVELMEDSYFMRKKFRHDARVNRKFYKMMAR